MRWTPISRRVNTCWPKRPFLSANFSAYGLWLIAAGFRSLLMPTLSWWQATSLKETSCFTLPIIKYYWQQRMKTRDKKRSGPASSTLTMSWKDFLVRLTLMSSLPVLRLNEPHRPRHLETLQLLVTDRWNSLFLKKTTWLLKSGNRSLNDSVKEFQREVSGKKKMPEKAAASDKKKEKEPDDDGPYQSTISWHWKWRLGFFCLSKQD